ncbi:hypothetical protein [Cryptosporangium sp. NPDC048952]|uniref:hypothetical protein n=1 Tax=Cryptosporangium sp. NPDC048952 TaxID=3363961 RepID=UPI003722829B
MATVSIAGDDLVVEIEGMDKLWSLKSRLAIPLVNVRGATADPGIKADPKGLRAPGTHLPGVLTAGTFHQDGERVFWNIRDGARAVVIALTDERYARLVVEVPDPAATVELIERAVSR